MKQAAEFNPMDFTGGARAVLGSLVLDSAAVVRDLAERLHGIHADWGGRLGIWHPKVESRQGLYYYHKHICPMDRGLMRQWPEWHTVKSLREVPLDYALKHEDFPVLSLGPGGSADLYEAQTAWIDHTEYRDVAHVGWAEVMWRLVHENLPGITPAWLTQNFRVPLDWMGQMPMGPIAYTLTVAREKGFRNG